MPCLCFQERSSEAEYYRQEVNPNCVTLTVPIHIIMCLSEKSPPELISQLWDFREEVIKYLSTKIFSDIHPNLINLEYMGASALESIEWRTGNKYNDNSDFMADSIAIKYNLEYTL